SEPVSHLPKKPPRTTCPPRVVRMRQEAVLSAGPSNIVFLIPELIMRAGPTGKTQKSVFCLPRVKVWRQSCRPIHSIPRTAPPMSGLRVPVDRSRKPSKYFGSDTLRRFHPTANCERSSTVTSILTCRLEETQAHRYLETTRRSA